MQTIQGNITGKRVAHPPKGRRVNDACAALGIGRSSLYKLRAQGKIRMVTIGGRTIVPESEIERLASEGA